MSQAWVTQPGHPGAKDLLSLYPTPRALRQALKEHPAVAAMVLSLPLNAEVSIGEVVSHLSLRARDIGAVHAIITQLAQDSEVWTAPDGTQTRRVL